MKYSVYMITALNSLDEIKEIKMQIEATEFSPEFITKYWNVAQFASESYEVTDSDVLVIANERIVKQLIIMVAEFGLKTTYKDVTEEVFKRTIDISKTPFCFKKSLLKYYLQSYTIDDVLDKMLLKGGIQALNDYDYKVLRNIELNKWLNGK